MITAQGLWNYSQSLKVKDLLALRKGCAIAFAQLHLSNPDDLEVATNLLELAERISATEFVSALANMNLPASPTPEIIDFVNYAQRFVRHAAEVEFLPASNQFFHLILKSQVYLSKSLPGWLLVGLGYADPANFEANFSRLESLLATKYISRGGEWIIDCLREAGIQESVIVKPAAKTPAWWLRMLRQAHSNIKINPAR